MYVFLNILNALFQDLKYLPPKIQSIATSAIFYAINWYIITNFASFLNITERVIGVIAVIIIFIILLLLLLLLLSYY